MKFRRWVEEVGRPARIVCDELDVPWQVCWGQARVESGAGRNVLARAHNYWGLKAGRGIGETSVVTKRTTEYGSDGRRRRVVADFAGFDSPEQGARGYCRFVTRSRYAAAEVLADDPLRWLAFVVGVGYATLAPGKYVRRFRRRLLWLQARCRLAKLPEWRELAPARLDQGLKESLRAMDKEKPGSARRAVARFELGTELRRLPFEVLDFCAGVVTVNQVRAASGLPPLQTGDVRVDGDVLAELNRALRGGEASASLLTDEERAMRPTGLSWHDAWEQALRPLSERELQELQELQRAMDKEARDAHRDD